MFNIANNGRRPRKRERASPIEAVRRIQYRYAALGLYDILALDFGP